MASVFGARSLRPAGRTRGARRPRQGARPSLRRVQPADLRRLLHCYRPPQDQPGVRRSQGDSGGGRRLVVIVEKSSELRDRKHTSRALVRAGHDQSGVVSGAAATAAHERSKKARVQERHRVQVDTNAADASLESGVDAPCHLGGGGDVVLARQTDGHASAVSLSISHCAPPRSEGPRPPADSAGEHRRPEFAVPFRIAEWCSARTRGLGVDKTKGVRASPASDSMSARPMTARQLPKASTRGDCCVAVRGTQRSVE